jgi:hypothetical protein
MPNETSLDRVYVSRCTTAGIAALRWFLLFRALLEHQQAS